jgi:glucokinase
MSSIDYSDDSRVVMTLDAGGTSFRFSAMRGNKPVTPTVLIPSEGDHLENCLNNIVEGFNQIKSKCPVPPIAISFAFPGPADYPNGIIGNLPNLSAFRDGVALGPMLEEKFKIPVFVNNDGDLFAYGEAIAGFLPYVNRLLERSGSPKRYKNLFGVTLGTGFGGGIVRDGELFVGDNSMAGEVWLLRNKTRPWMNVEESASIRAVRQIYAAASGIQFEEAPDPKEIAAIAHGKSNGFQEGALEAYRRLGEAVGDAIANALTLIDGLAVIGGGLSNAHELFLPAVAEELDGFYTNPMGQKIRRLAFKAFNLEEESHLNKFVEGHTREIAVPGSDRKIKYDSLPRTGVGISRLGTSQAIAVGAYAFALRKLS